MSKTDIQRWQGWRVSRTRPLRPVRRCQCGAEFLPLVRGQQQCGACISAQHEIGTLPQIDFDAADLRARQSVIDETRRRRKARQGPVEDGPIITREPRPKRRKGHLGRQKKARHSKPAQWAHIALRRWKNGAEPRWIASFLDVSVDEVLEVIKGHDRPTKAQQKPERPGESKAKRQLKRRHRAEAARSGRKGWA